MTYLYANDQTNLESISFHFFYGIFYDAQLFENDVTGDPDFIWEDAYHLETVTGDALSLYGFDFAYAGERINGVEFISEGTIEALSQWASNGVDAWIETWHWSGLMQDYGPNETPLDMGTWFDVAATTGYADDAALVQQILSSHDEMLLSNFDDDMRGFSGNDEIYGYFGNDTLRGDNGRDAIYGNADNDVLFGGNGMDYLVGGIGMDTIYGGAGNDRLYGSADDDLLKGGGENDYLRGGAGRDVLLGGDQGDIFNFKTGDDIDIIKDFTISGPDMDRIDVSDLESVVDFADLIDNHAEQRDANVRIDGLDGDVIVIKNVDLADLNSSHFIFV